MLNVLEEEVMSVVDACVESSAAWMNPISGLEAEKLLRGRKSFTYILRAGEKEMAREYDALTKNTNYYVTFVDQEGCVRHQPFVVSITEAAWYCENGGGCGPFVEQTIEDVLHMLVYANNKNDLTPFVNK